MEASYSFCLSTASAAGSHVSPASGQAVVTSPAMRVVSGNASTISLIAQAASETAGGATTATIGGRQIVTVPAGQAGLPGTKGPVQITITPANRAGISTISLPSNIRQVAKPVVVSAPATNGTQVVRLGGATVVTVNPSSTSAVDQTAAMISTETQAAADALVQQSGGDADIQAASLQQFDGASDDVFEDGVVEDVLDCACLFPNHDVVDEDCTEFDEADTYFFSSGDHQYAFTEEVTDFEEMNGFMLPQFDGADDEDEEGGGEDEEMESDAHSDQIEQQQQEEAVTVHQDVGDQVEPGHGDGMEAQAMEEGDAGLESSLIGQVSHFTLHVYYIIIIFLF